MKRLAIFLDGTWNTLNKRTHGIANFVQHIVWQWQQG
jgi:hypothetical protein